MIVCHCNVLTVEDIQGAVDELLTEMPLRVITPGLVYRRLGTRGRCCGCFPLAIDVINAISRSGSRQTTSPNAGSRSSSSSAPIARI